MENFSHPFTAENDRANGQRPTQGSLSRRPANARASPGQANESNGASSPRCHITSHLSKPAVNSPASEVFRLRSGLGWACRQPYDFISSPSTALGPFEVSTDLSVTARSISLLQPSAASAVAPVSRFSRLAASDFVAVDVSACDVCVMRIIHTTHTLQVY